KNYFAGNRYVLNGDTAVMLLFGANGQVAGIQMGHYWYDISKNMNCKDFYPVFIMYNRNRLEGFGWNTNGDLKSPRYEHPTSDRFG
ncbi:hypothetical protein QZH41_011726, partial [Actinostola sp. cb2023]